MLLRRLKERLIKQQNSGIFRHIPLPQIKGKLYASPMPFGAYDRGSRLLKIYRQCHIHHVIMVVTEQELKKKARRNIEKLYEKSGITYSRFSIKDFQAPTYALIHALVNEAVQRLEASRNVVVHCHAGVGRTAIAICCIVKTIQDMSATEAIDYARTHMDINMTPEQIRVINAFEKHLENKQVIGDR